LVGIFIATVRTAKSKLEKGDQKRRRSGPP
jgi:hypothetical protein